MIEDSVDLAMDNAVPSRLVLIRHNKRAKSNEERTLMGIAKNTYYKIHNLFGVHGVLHHAGFKSRLVINRQRNLVLLSIDSRQIGCFLIGLGWIAIGLSMLVIM